MRKIIVFCITTILLLGCSGSGVPVEVSKSNPGEDHDYYVRKLFTVDGITVYRFIDDGHYHYFTNRGTTITRVSEGKTSRDETIEDISYGE